MKKLVLVLLFLALLGLPTFASTITSVTSQLGLASCTQSDPMTATCTNSNTFNIVGSSAQSNIISSSGLLDVVVNASHTSPGQNQSPSGTALASFSVALVVNGGVGTGVLMANFFGFDNAFSSDVPPPSPSLSLILGSTITSITPGIVPAPFSITAPFTYGTPLSFQGSISASAQAPFLMMNASSSGHSEGRVSFNGFTLLGVSGQPIPGQVVFTPEPATFECLFLALLALGYWRFRRSARIAA